MGLHRTPRFAIWSALALMFAAGACDRKGGAPGRAVERPTVASLVPAATDLIIGMGAENHLVAVSTYDVQRPETAGLPRVGDYQSLDWEQLSAIHPAVMVLFMAPDRMPAGVKQRAGQLGIRLVNVRTESMEDVLRTMADLGDVLEERDRSEVLARQINQQMRETSRRVAGRPRVRTLVVREKTPEGVVGRGNFIHELLRVAGGENVVQASGWPSIDREMLLSLKPEVVIQLLPGASPQVVEEARRTWDGLGEVPAVKTGRVYILTEWWVLQPGSHVGELAGKFAELLHPQGPATTRTLQ
jgi:iron complex transport system substrate-binding protein